MEKEEKVKTRLVCFFSLGFLFICGGFFPMILEKGIKYFGEI